MQRWRRFTSVLGIRTCKDQSRFTSEVWLKNLRGTWPSGGRTDHLSPPRSTPDQQTTPAPDTRTLRTPSGYAGQNLPSELAQYHPHSAHTERLCRGNEACGRERKENGGSSTKTLPTSLRIVPAQGTPQTHSTCIWFDVRSTTRVLRMIIRNLSVTQPPKITSTPHHHGTSTELET